MASQATHPNRDLAVIIGLLAFWLFGFPLSIWWLLGPPAWYLPYVLWLGVILLILLVRQPWSRWWGSHREP